MERPKVKRLPQYKKQTINKLWLKNSGTLDFLSEIKL